MDKRYEEISKRVMNRLTQVHSDGRQSDHLSLDTWEWPQGVAMYSMVKIWKATGDRAIYDEILAWYENHLRRGLPGHNVNTTAPMLGMTYLYEETHDEKWGSLIREWAEWVMREMPRTQEGGLQHITSDSENKEQLWDDTLFMTGLFLYRAGETMGREDWKQEATYQFLLHIKYLHCDDNGLWYHGFTFEGRHHFGNAFWARGNSWITAGAVDFCEMLPDGPSKRLILTTWQEQCAALVKLQDSASGLWHTLLDHADSYLETSASAAIAYGLLKGVRLGLLPAGFEAAAEKACDGVLAMVEQDGTVGGVSYGTPMGADLDFYRGIPLRPTAYGQGLVFLMLTEKRY